MKRFWTEIFLYGLSIGLLLVALRFMQYRWVFGNAVEWYSAVLAVLFCTVGIWAGMKLARRKSLKTPHETPPLPVQTIHQLGLTPREVEVLQLMAQGHSNQEIADQLFVSLNTVKTHISNLLSKLDAQRRTQAIQKAKMLGLIR